jgi:hypothetical protein
MMAVTSRKLELRNLNLVLVCCLVATSSLSSAQNNQARTGKQASGQPAIVAGLASNNSPSTAATQTSGPGNAVPAGNNSSQAAAQKPGVPPTQTNIGPKEATEFMTAFVPAFSPCKKPNSVTLATAGVPLPACTPAQRGDAQCSFGPDGHGKLSVRAIDADLMVEAEMEGIVGCENSQLRVVMTSRGTVNYCPDGECTTIDVADFPVGLCTVKDGKCSIKNSVNTYTKANEGFKVFEPGTRTKLTLLGCSVLHGDVRLFECGILVK